MNKEKKELILEIQQTQSQSNEIQLLRVRPNQDIDPRV